VAIERIKIRRHVGQDLGAMRDTETEPGLCAADDIGSLTDSPIDAVLRLQGSVRHDTARIGDVGPRSVSISEDVAGQGSEAKAADAPAISAAADRMPAMVESPFDEPCRKRERRRLGDAAGLTQFGVNLLRLPPGAWSSQRHWHTKEDEFVFVLSGEVVLVTDSGEEVLRAGDAAGFKADDPNGHCLRNRSNRDAQVLEIGTPSALSKRPHARAALREIEFAVAALRRLLGSDARVRAWLNAPHPDLGGDAPLALLMKGSAKDLADYVRSALSGQPT